MLLAAFSLMFNWVNSNGEYMLGRLVKEDAARAVAAGSSQPTPSDKHIRSVLRRRFLLLRDRAGRLPPVVRGVAKSSSTSVSKSARFSSAGDRARQFFPGARAADTGGAPLRKDRRERHRLLNSTGRAAISPAYLRRVPVPAGPTGPRPSARCPAGNCNRAAVPPGCSRSRRTSS